MFYEEAQKEYEDICKKIEKIQEELNEMHLRARLSVVGTETITSGIIRMIIRLREYIFLSRIVILLKSWLGKGI